MKAIYSTIKASTTFLCKHYRFYLTVVKTTIHSSFFHSLSMTTSSLSCAQSAPTSSPPQQSSALQQMWACALGADRARKSGSLERQRATPQLENRASVSQTSWNLSQRSHKTRKLCRNNNLYVQPRKNKLQRFFCFFFRQPVQKNTIQ